MAKRDFVPVRHEEERHPDIMDAIGDENITSVTLHPVQEIATALASVAIGNETAEVIRQAVRVEFDKVSDDKAASEKLWQQIQRLKQAAESAAGTAQEAYVYNLNK